MKQLVSFSILLLSLGCGTAGKQENPEGTQRKASAREADHRLAEADSLVMVYYDDPFMADSLQYTRYYHQISKTDSGEIRMLAAHFQQQVRVQEKPMPCRNEGKIWMFRKGKIFQTVYFAFSKPGCSFLFFIKDGRFYFTAPDPALIQWLRNSRPSIPL